jgi:CRISPR-associated protein Cmx8
MTKQKQPRGAKAPKSARGEVPTGPLTLRYTLSELTSTQHRAGLAGLVLMTRWLERAPGEKPGLCRLTQLDDAGLTLEVDRDGMVRLFDELYAATEEEKFEKKQRDGEPCIRTEERSEQSEKTGKTTTKTWYVYPQVVPRAPMLVDHEPGNGGENGLWVKLWRDMVWNILRGVPAQRGPFNKRAQKLPTTDAADMWKQLVDPTDPAVALPSTYYLGAQEHTAENVDFKDRARRQFLLHFWPYAAQVYVPRVLDPREGQEAFDGFAIAIPDVALLATYCDDFSRALRQRSADTLAYRPRGAVLDLAVEAALDVALRLRDAVAAGEGRSATSDLVLGYEVLHVDKDGNNVRLYSAARVSPDAALLVEYERMRGRLVDPLFRRQVLLNVVAGRAWFAGFDRLAEITPLKSRDQKGEKPAGFRRWQFCHDAVKMFQERRVLMEKRAEGPVGEKNLDVLVNEMIRNYVSRKAEARSGTSWAKAKESLAQKKAWEEQKERAASEAFLAVRSRTEADFVDYFVGTLCSKGQYLRDGRFETIAAALRRPAALRDVRTLTLLALSAECWMPTGNNEKKSEE